MRAYVAKRNAEGRPLVYNRAGEDRSCGYCGVAFFARFDRVGKYCSARCALDAQGYSPISRFRIGKRARFAIYERHEWRCQLCFRDIDRTAHFLAPLAPTLDHIMPRSRGGVDAEYNLRLACRDCNSKRKSNLDWVPDLSNL